MKLLKLSVCSVAISGLSIGYNCPQVSAFTIDLFSENQFAGSNQATSGTFTNDSVTDSTNIFGGDRFISTTISGGSGSPVTFNGINIFGDEASIIAEPGATVSGFFEWGGISDSGSSLDLTDSGDSDLIQVSIESVSETVSLEFTVKDADGTVGMLSQNVLDEETGNYYYSFSDFSSTGGEIEGVDFEAIDYVKMGTVGMVPPQLDLTFSLVQSSSVPFEFSPSLGLILCGGLFGIKKLRKKLKNNQFLLDNNN